MIKHKEEEEVINIPIKIYRKIVNGQYINSTDVDEELGIEYMPHGKVPNYFLFKVKDRNKLLLAKIKYCI